MLLSPRLDISQQWCPEPASHQLKKPNLGTTYSLKDQRDLGAGVGFAVSFQQGFEGHTEKASFCGMSKKQKGISLPGMTTGLRPTRPPG